MCPAGDRLRKIPSHLSCRSKVVPVQAVSIADLRLEEPRTVCRDTPGFRPDLSRKQSRRQSTRQRMPVQLFEQIGVLESLTVETAPWSAAAEYIRQ